MQVNALWREVAVGSCCWYLGAWAEGLLLALLLPGWFSSAFRGMGAAGLCWHLPLSVSLLEEQGSALTDGQHDLPRKQK